MHRQVPLFNLNLSYYSNVRSLIKKNVVFAQVTVSCENPSSMVVTIETPGSVVGAIYVKDQVKTSECLVQPVSAKTEFVIPFDKCGTKKV